jgi:outer membrane lipoprotein SlyB
LRPSKLLVCLLIAAFVAGCAATNATVSGSPAPTVPPKAASVGKILSMRSVTAQSNSAPWRSVLLADAGAAGASNDSGKNALTEFIVRTDDGATISVVQSNEPGFRPGDPVIILRDGPTRLARPG